MPSTPNVDLDGLLTALRAAGLRVGVDETLRLQAVFARGPDLTRLAALRDPHDDDEKLRNDALRAILAAVLAKSTEQRATLDRIVQSWIGEASVRLQPPRDHTKADAGPLPPPPIREPQKQAARRGLGRHLAIAIIALLVAVSVPFLRRTPSVETPPTTTAVDRPPIGRESDTAIQLAKTFRASVARIVPNSIVPYRDPLWSRLGIAVAALVVTAGLWLNFRRYPYLPEKEPLATRGGPPRVFLDPPLTSRRLLIDRKDEEQLVWGIGQFVSEEPTRHLDLDRTVRSTAAAGGLPCIHFQHARYHREVWLWVDQAAAVYHPTINRLAAELQATLTEGGLPVERADFWGIPERFTLADRTQLGPNELDERRDAAIVAILTDGRLLAQDARDASRRRQITALLRTLGNWPRLAFVDFANNRHGLAALLEKNEIPRIDPEQVAAFLGAATLPQIHAKDRDLAGDDLIWAAACAVSPQPVAETTASALADRLTANCGVAPAPWTLKLLNDRFPGPVGRIAFAHDDRRTLLRWLRAAETIPIDGDLTHGSVLRTALTFWIDRYDTDLRDRADRDSTTPWKDTPAEQQLRMERALLDLWIRPDHAARELYALFQGGLEAAIRSHLSYLGDANCCAKAVPLPWTLAKRDADVRVALAAMGFAADCKWQSTETLRRPGRLWLALGVGLGISCAASINLFRERPTRSDCPDVVETGAVPTQRKIDKVANNGGCTLSVLTPRTALHLDVDAGAKQVTIDWSDATGACAEKTDGGEVWRCGSNPQPTRPEVADWPLRRTFWLDAPATADMRLLAMQLLDSGSADMVALGGPLPVAFDGTEIVSINIDQADQASAATLTLPVNTWRRAAGALTSFSGLRDARDIWSFASFSGTAPIRLAGLGDSWCPYRELEENGIVWVRVCAGTFTMGSNDGGADEKPLHEVTLSEFWIGKYEVSQAQYQRLIGDNPSTEKGEDLPVTDVDWTKASEFCAGLGKSGDPGFVYRLPTEAEWEYAARGPGPNPRSYPWGEEPPDETHAVFDRGFDGKPDPVQRLPAGAGPFGTFNQAGNVWEWVEDWYGDYPAEAQTNPTGARSGSFRVLRGGSFRLTAGNLRSAFRVRSGPGYWSWFDGFRCVRSSRRSP